MKDDCPSMTAYQVALMRAGHQVFDDPRVFDDPLAMRIIGAQGEAKLHARKRFFGVAPYSHLRALVVARSRYTEEMLSDAVRAGVRQYVALGAGLDTFAYRNPYASAGLKVFEVDFPATQAWKRGLLAAAGIMAPENLVYVPVDFEKQSLAGQLIQAGFDGGEPAFFSWLGVTMYLAYETVMETMKFIYTSTPAGSGVVFDYMTPHSAENILRRLIMRLLSHRMMSIGEPWVNFMEPEGLVKDLKEIGYTQVEDMGRRER